MPGASGSLLHFEAIAAVTTMPRFAANVSFLWTELPFLERFQAAASAGFRAVEFHYPYEFDAADLRHRLDAAGVSPVLINIRAGDARAGEAGLACLPGREGDFRACVAEAIDYALRVGAPQANCLAGNVPEGADRDECEAVFIGNLKYAADAFRKAGLRLMVEPLNSRDMPRFLVHTSSHALALIDRAGRDNVFLQYDLYHMQIMEGDLAPTLEKWLPRIGHIQFADTPGRHEPGTGEVNFPFLFAHLDRIGYSGWVSAEYRPLTGTDASLGWMSAQRSKERA
jgi:hydroxypyruvate isomerase